MVASASHIEQWEELPEAQQQAWSGFLGAYASIARELDAELCEAHGLSLSSYDALVRLSRAPGGRMQMFELAEAMRFSRSGLTRMVDRLECKGLLERCRGSDPRTTFACITEEGLQRLAEATPTHLDGVRRRFLDRLSGEQIQELADIWHQLLEPSEQEEHD